MTAQQLRQVHKRLKCDIALCPLCNKDIHIPRVDPDDVEYVKTSTGGVNVYHRVCIENYMKGGLK